MSELTREDAEEFTGALEELLNGSARFFDLGGNLGVPQALGLSADDWQARLALSVPARRAAVKRLTAPPENGGEGMSNRKAAKVLGVDPKTVRNDRKAAGEKSPPLLGEPGEKSPPEKTKGQLSNQAGGSDAWSTPRDLFDELDREFRFETDVCALPSSAKCERYFTPEQDGLAQDWTGTCWMNPPYGDAIPEWVGKARAAGDAGATVVCLLPARVDTAWWWDHCRHGEIRFLRGRLKFGGSANSAPFPSALVVFGPDVEPCVKWWER